MHADFRSLWYSLPYCCTLWPDPILWFRTCSFSWAINQSFHENQKWPPKTRFLFFSGILRRVYTQNIDALENLGGLPEEKIIEAHGTFRTAYCQACNEQYDLPWLKKEIFNPDTNDGVPKCHKCKTGIVRPDIVFFGEKLPTKFWNSIGADFRYGLILF